MIPTQKSQDCERLELNINLYTYLYQEKSKELLPIFEMNKNINVKNR